ncbi:M20 family metallopeptidase [Deferribacter thermophilus]|uniref:M20 metallopeptidase family protein n=1 Tax=Deferribacter thermophilus TaxID=53573 RepID=UPI003C1977BA
MLNYEILHDLENLAEVSFNEFKTTEYIKNFLNNNGIKIDKVLKTGCFGTIDFGKSKTVAIRADIDALPVNAEKTEAKHLCGHHLHTSALLLVLKKISTGEIKPNVNIRYIFQPAEEIISGAKLIIQEGGLDGVSEIYGIHVDPEIELGAYGIKPGELMAGSNHFHIILTGKGTHGAYPHMGNDLIVAAADLINLAQKIVSRKINPLYESLITFGKIEGGTAGNILPSELRIDGTFRYFKNELLEFLKSELKNCCKSIEEFYKIKIDLVIEDGTPPVINDEGLSLKMIDLFENNGEKVFKNIPKTMGGEDFALYQRLIPGVFARVGIKEGGKVVPLHNINFKVPDRALDSAVRFWEILLNNI